MKLSLFDSFADMIGTIPVGAILRTLEREQRMIEEDLAYQRPVSLKEAESILNFCYYVEAVREGLPGWAFTLPLPPEHLTFYRKTLDRLITAQELPPGARAEFDSFIPGVGLKQLQAAA
ncbi:MAG: hypothetical protein P4N60_00215 [Verrucomicrobiae bacterium]|nr:hypothetical protein [Verrucomicrobiae bacterium]